MLFSGFMIVRELYGKKKAADSFDSAAKLVYSMPENDPDTGENTGDTEVNTPTVRDISALIAEYPDCAGWVCIDKTPVDYPVVYTPLQPQKYLRLGLDGKYSACGIPFIDAGCSPDSDVIIIYGHNMRDRTMFSSLMNYENRKYFEEHPIIEFETVNQKSDYAVFAVAIIDENDKWYGFVDVENSDEMIPYIKSLSLYDTGITPAAGDDILTLSTCYGSSKTQRIVVVAAKSSSE